MIEIENAKEVHLSLLSLGAAFPFFCIQETKGGLAWTLQEL